MNPIEFFFDERQIDSFSLDLHDGKTTLTCTVIERWDELLGRVYRCGNGETQKIVRHRGISVEERQNLEATIKSSLGLTGIAELKSAIKGEVARKIEFEESQDLTREFTFAAPKCGRLELLWYQLKRLYRFQCSDRRRWHTGSWTRTFTEWVDLIYDATQRFPYDPNCNCEPKSAPKNDGSVTILLGDKIAMRTGYRRDGATLTLPELNVSFGEKNLNDILFGTFSVPRDAVPPHLLFLASETAETLTARIVPSMGDRVAECFREQSPLHEPTTDRQPGITYVELALFLAGASIGTALAFLFSSKSGEGTREYLATRADEGSEYAQKKARELRKRAEKMIKRSDEIMSRQKDAMSSAASAAVEAGKEAYREREKKTRRGERTKTV